MAIAEYGIDGALGDAGEHVLKDPEGKTGYTNVTDEARLFQLQGRGKESTRCVVTEEVRRRDYVCNGWVQWARWWPYQGIVYRTVI